jgi:hypothetical protein
MIERLPSGVLIDHRRPEKMDYMMIHSRSNRLCSGAFVGHDEFLKITPQTFTNYDFAVWRFGDGSAGKIIDSMVKSLKFTPGKNLVVVWEGGGSAQTLLHTLIDGDESEIPEGYKEVYPPELYLYRESHPLEIEFVLSGGTTIKTHCAYLVGEDPFGIYSTEKKEELIRRFPYMNTHLAYIFSAISSGKRETLKGRIQPEKIIYKRGEEEYEVSGPCFAIASVTSTDRIATVRVHRKLSPNQVRLWTCRASDEDSLGKKYNKALFVGAVFPKGPDKVVEAGLIELFDADEVIIYPDRREETRSRKRLNIGGQLYRLNTDSVQKLIIRRSKHKITYIIPKEITRRGIQIF